MIVIIDYGIGNPRSINNMLHKIDVESIISANSADIANAEKLILPGVGSFDAGMMNLEKMGILKILNEKVMREKTPILGICLGMQLFAKKSEEGVRAGLGWINANVIRFSFVNTLSNFKIPHMSWNTVNIQKNSELFQGIEDPRFYFVHSYHVKCENEEDILCNTTYGCEFHAAVKKDNVIGVQFHPEKSHKFGMKFLKNFSGLKKE